MTKTAYVVRKHPTKNKPLVTPCTSIVRLSQLMGELRRKNVPASVTFSKTNVSSGEDCYG